MEQGSSTPALRFFLVAQCKTRGTDNWQRSYIQRAQVTRDVLHRTGGGTMCIHFFYNHANDDPLREGGEE